MPETKECPLCGGTMRYRVTQSTVQGPGNPQASERTAKEWVCPECDYYEEADVESGR